MKLKLTYRGHRITVVRIGWRRWQYFVAGPPGVGGLSMDTVAVPVFWSLMGAIWIVQDQTRETS